ncbi:hypothetical protein [Humidesulfovibrio idahonensis]
MKVAALCLVALPVLCACSFSTQSRYGYSEVGQIQVVEFGAVLAVRDIEIVGENSGAGALLGGAGGAAAGAYSGKGFGAVAGGTAGAVAGGVIGSALEQAIRNRGGVEYTVALRNGKVLTIAQNVSKEDTVFKVGDRVMIQINGQYQRVLPANALPTEVAKPRGVEVK